MKGKHFDLTLDDVITLLRGRKLELSGCTLKLQASLTAPLRDQAKARIVGWKKKHRSMAIAPHLGIYDALVSNLYTGNGYVSGNVIQKVLDAPEMK